MVSANSLPARSSRGEGVQFARKYIRRVRAYPGWFWNLDLLGRLLGPAKDRRQVASVQIEAASTRSGLRFLADDVDGLVTADGLEIEKNQEVNQCHRGRNEGIHFQGLPVARHVSIHDRLLGRRPYLGLDGRRRRELLSVDAVNFLEDEPLAGSARLVFSVDGRIALLQRLAGESVLGVAQSG